MAVFTRSAFVGLAVVLSVLAGAANAQQLSTTFYSTSCRNLSNIVGSEMFTAVKKDPRMAASILRLFFHDCFVNGCDGSILLENGGEKTAPQNVNSVRGYNVIDDIKFQVEKFCKAKVSCADILALAARDAVKLSGGPTWDVRLGRKDSRRGGNTGDLPGTESSVADLKTKFEKKKFSLQDMTALSGAHTIGRAQCKNFRNRIYNEKNINTDFARRRQMACPRSGGDTNLADFDVKTNAKFDNAYYQNLVEKKGLLHSDQVLFNNGSQDGLVRTYSTNQARFFADFVTAMKKMGDLLPSAGTPTEVRLNCRRPN